MTSQRTSSNLGAVCALLLCMILLACGGSPPPSSAFDSGSAAGDGAPSHPGQRADAGPGGSAPTSDATPGAAEAGSPAPSADAGAAAPSSCGDECNLGATRNVGGTTQRCMPVSAATQSTVALGTGLHDRARGYNQWLRRWHLPTGTVSSTRFADWTLKKAIYYGGMGDSAIWTGSYLAAEALRGLHTRSTDAEQNMRRLVEALHRNFEVTGNPGYMARHVVPLDSPDPLVRKLYNPADPGHHKTTYRGKPMAWAGHTSRDQYQGLVMGYALAYDALASAAHRKMIRDDVVAICRELIKERKQLPLKLRFYALGKWHEITTKMDLRHVILAPSEFEKGAPYVQIGSDNNRSAYGSSTLSGLREFWPDFAVALRQVPILGILVPASLPRPGSAVMLATMLRLGMHVTEGVAAHAADYQAIKRHYDTNIGAWLSIMEQYAYLNAGKPRCWSGYFGINIVFQPMYNLIRLESNSTIRRRLQGVLAKKMWPYVKDHKNTFFSFIYSSQSGAGAAAQAAVAPAVAQLSQFPPAPRRNRKVDIRGKYPEHPQCPGQAAVAVDIKDRVVGDFQWQREPFALASGPVDPWVHPGVDYLLAYWMGRHHGFIKDERPDVCLRWR